MIDGVGIHPLRIIEDPRGSIRHMLRRDDSHFRGFGEIYFSTVRPGVVKGWHLHSRMVLNYALLLGHIRLVLYDAREGSPTNREVQVIELTQQNYSLVTIPPGVWNGFLGLGDSTSLVANCATIPHDPTEIERKHPKSPDIPYDWGDISPVSG